MQKHELFLHYWHNPLPVRKPPEPVVTDTTQCVIPYVKWIKNKCRSCKRGGCSGLWLATFSDGSQYHIPLCANCGLNSIHIPKACGVTGFGAPAFLHLDLLITLTYPNRTETITHD